jgi:uncharacterized protein
MRWEGHAQSSNVEDRRGMGRTGLAVGGTGGIILLVLGLIFGVDLGGGGGGPGLQQPGGGPPPDDKAREFSATVLKFTEDVWNEEFQKVGERYQPPKMVLFSDGVDTRGCGSAPSAVGPFYCPADRTVYLDPTFFDELERKLGGSKGDFSKAYVIAHEVGHHVQNLLGYSERVDRERRRGKTEGNRASVRLELQADYLAGVWAHHGQRKFNFIEPGDIESAMTTAQAIGDDRIQKRSRGWVSPESYTHGTSAQRVRAFREGLRTGDLSRIKHYFEVRYEEL